MGVKNIFSGTVIFAILGVFFFINALVIAFIFIWNR